MKFAELLRRAQSGDTDAISNIADMYRPLIMKESLVNGIHDEDLYQELSLTLLKCIQKKSV